MGEPSERRGGRGRMRQLWWLALLAGLVGLSTCGGCILPPAILPAGSKEQPATFFYPDGTQQVEIPVESGVLLRGVFVPSDPGAPVVLHLLESAGSVGQESAQWSTDNGIAGTIPGVRAIFSELAHLGFASLAVDHEGVGASDGERSPRHLRRDALAAWEEAVRRAGGRPDRVVVRGTSIGTLAAAHLLEAGCEPAGLVLASPVLSDTVAKHFGRAQYGAFLTAIVLPFLEDVTDVDLDTALLAHPAAHFVWALAGDELLPAEDLARLRTAVEAAGGQLEVVEQYQEQRELPPAAGLERHIQGVLAARHLLSGEAQFLAGLLPGVPPSQRRIAAGRAGIPADLLARFAPSSSQERLLDELLGSRLDDDPVLVAWCALGESGTEQARRVLQHFGGSAEAWREGGTAQSLSQRLSTDDPAGPLPLEPLLQFAGWLRTYETFAERLSVDELLDVVAGCGVAGLESAPWNPALTTQGGTTFNLRYACGQASGIRCGGQAPWRWARRLDGCCAWCSGQRATGSVSSSCRTGPMGSRYTTDRAGVASIRAACCGRGRKTAESLFSART